MKSFNNTKNLYDEMEPIIEELKVDKKDIRLLHEHSTKLLEAYKRSKKYYIIRMVLFVLLYISFVSAMFNDVFLLSETVNFITAISGVVGSITLIILLAIVQKLISINLNKAHIHANYITALDVKYR